MPCAMLEPMDGASAEAVPRAAAMACETIAVAAPTSAAGLRLVTIPVTRATPAAAPSSAKRPGRVEMKAVSSPSFATTPSRTAPAPARNACQAASAPVAASAVTAWARCTAALRSVKAVMTRPMGVLS